VFLFVNLREFKLKVTTQRCKFYGMLDYLKETSNPKPKPPTNEDILTSSTKSLVAYLEYKGVAVDTWSELTEHLDSYISLKDGRYIRVGLCNAYICKVTKQGALVSGKKL
jgi:hypothetical protein